MEKEPKEKKVLKMSLGSAIVIVVLLLTLLAAIALLGISILKPRVREENGNKVQEIVNKESYEENVIIDENKTEKTYTEIYSSMDLEILETLRIYNDNTLTIKLSEHGRTLPKGWPVIEANKEYSITGISDKIKVAKFITPIFGGSYEGSYLFMKTEKNELYLVYTVDGLRTGKFEAVKVLIDDYNEEWPILDVRFNSEGFEEPIIIANTVDGKYIIKSDGTLEKYEDATEEKIENDNAQSNNNENIEPENNIQPGENIPIEDIIEKFLNIKCMGGWTIGPLCEIGYSEDYFNYENKKEINGEIYYGSEIKYEEAKKIMLCYMTEELYNEMFQQIYKNIDGKLYSVIYSGSGCGYSDTTVQYVSSDRDVDKFLVTTTYMEVGMYEPYQYEIEIEDRIVSKCKEIGILKDKFGITSIEKNSNVDDYYDITGYVLEDEIKKVSVEEFKNVRNGGKIEFRNETWQLQNVQNNENLTLVSNSGKKIALVMQDDGYAYFINVAGAVSECADYSNTYIKFTLPKDASIKVTGGADGSTTIEEFAKTNYKNRSGAYAEYTPIIRNNEMIGFSCLAY